MITRQQQRCLDVIKRLTQDGGSPSLDEIGAEMGIVKSAVSRLVDCLIEAGAVRRLGKWRGLAVVGPLEADVARLVAVHGLEAVADQIVKLGSFAA